MKSLHYQFRLGHSTICKIIPEVCTAIYEELQQIYMKVQSMHLFFIVAQYNNFCYEICLQ